MNTDSVNDIVDTKTIEAKKGEYIPMPNASTTYCLPGPSKMEVNRYRDGRLEGKVIEGEVKPMRLAVHKQWKRLTWGI